MLLGKFDKCSILILLGHYLTTRSKLSLELLLYKSILINLAHMKHSLDV